MFKLTPLLIVADQQTLEEVARSLLDQPALAVDTEADSLHHYQEKVCLIQISDPTRDIIVDPLQLSDLSPLAEVFSNPAQVKVFHGADYDVVSLKRDFGFETRNIFDTMLASQFLGFERIGLADLINRFFGIEIDKRYQRHDWAQRPLLEEHLDYARGDTHWLLALREVLSYKLEKVGRLEHVLEECSFVEGRQWSGRGIDPSVDFLRVKGTAGLSETSMKVLRALVTYRNDSARELDRPAFKVIPDDRLVALAAELPQTPEALNHIVRPGTPLHRRHADGLLHAVLKGISDETPLPARNRASPTARLPVAEGGGERLLGPLKAWRNEVVTHQGFSPAVVANNTVLKEIARLAPTTLEALAQVPGIRSWQLRDFGPQIVELIQGAMGEAKPARTKRRRRRRKPSA